METSNFDEEYWRAMPGFDNYIVSTYGHARKVKSDILQTYDKESGTKNIPSFTESGYDFWRLYTRSHQMKIVRIDEKVAETFLNKPFGSVKLKHLDGNIHNNAAWNLEWVFDADDAGKKVAEIAIKHVKDDLKSGAIKKEVEHAVKDIMSDSKPSSQGDDKGSQVSDSSSEDTLTNPAGLDDLISDINNTDNDSSTQKHLVDTKVSPKKKSGKYRVVRQSDEKEYSSISNLSSTEGLPYEKVRDALNSKGTYTTEDGEVYVKESI